MGIMFLVCSYTLWLVWFVHLLGLVCTTLLVGCTVVLCVGDLSIEVVRM